MTYPSITLKPVYSAPAQDVPSDIRLPSGWTLAWHQLETLKALRDPSIDVVFNTAMTGDGKSLAAYLDTLVGDRLALGLYPTNALARDQELQIQDYIAKFWTQPKPPRVNRLSGPELEIYSETEGLRKGSAIATRAGQSEVLITNPDIFHYLHRGAYLSSKYDNPDKLWNLIDKDFDLFIFDEFHVFSTPQVASVLNTMLLIRATNRRKKFLFLSATPNKKLLGRLGKAGFTHQLVDPASEGKYRFSRPEGIDQPKQWRQVARSIELTFVPVSPTSQASEAWLKENQALLLRQFDHPGSKGAIILNSIAAVKRLVPVLREWLDPHGLVVKENTGLTGGREKVDSLSADLVIGTSTIDVGVDFKINFLIFESSDAGNFIQRLGRLGRHDKNTAGETFDGFRGWALVPKFFIERLFTGDSAAFSSGETCDRLSFQSVIREQYRQINDFEGHYKRWGAVQSVSLGRQLAHSKVKQQYQDSVQRFQNDCETVFDTRFGRVFGQMKAWSSEWQALSGQKSGNPIAEDAMSFRGSSPLLCGLYDLTEPCEGDRFKTYDLPGVLGNLDIEMWSKAAFLRELDETAQRLGEPIAKGRFKYCLGFMKLRGYREERLNWKFTYPSDLKPVADDWKVQVLAGLSIWQPDNYWASAINRRLQTQALVCYVLAKPVGEVRARLQLPMHFQIYPISDGSSVHDAIAPYSVAFGQGAMLIDTLAYRFKREGGEIWIA